MADEVNTGEIPAEPGDKPAETPAADTAPKEGAEKTQEQLDAEKAAEEAKQKEADDAEEQAIRKKPWFQKRIDEITRQRHESERRAERLEQMLAQVIEQAKLSTRQPGQQTPQPAQEAQFTPTRPAPTREQFEFDEEKYLNAVVDWRLEQREAKAAQDKRVAEQQTTQTEFVRTYESNRVKTVETGREKYPDYEQVVFSLPSNVMTPEMALAIFETAIPADISYHLGKNPAEAERIAKLPPLKKAIELGKLETQIVNAAKRTSAAPPPPTPLRGGATHTPKEDELPYDEWLKKRKAGQIDGRA